MNITHVKRHLSLGLRVASRIERRAVFILLCSFGVLTILYVYFIGSAVVDAVVRNEVQQEVARTYAQVAALERAYLDERNDVTRELATELGLRAVARKEYVERSRYLGRADSDQGGL